MNSPYKGIALAALGFFVFFGGLYLYLGKHDGKSNNSEPVYSQLRDFDNNRFLQPVLSTVDKEYLTAVQLSGQVSEDDEKDIIQQESRHPFPFGKAPMDVEFTLRAGDLATEILEETGAVVDYFVIDYGDDYPAESIEAEGIWKDVHTYAVPGASYPVKVTFVRQCEGKCESDERPIVETYEIDVTGVTPGIPTAIRINKCLTQFRVQDREYIIVVANYKAPVFFETILVNYKDVPFLKDFGLIGDEEFSAEADFVEESGRYYEYVGEGSFSWDEWIDIWGRQDYSYWTGAVDANPCSPGAFYIRGSYNEYGVFIATDIIEL